MTESEQRAIELIEEIKRLSNGIKILRAERGDNMAILIPYIQKFRTGDHITLDGLSWRRSRNAIVDEVYAEVDDDSGEVACGYGCWLMKADGTASRRPLTVRTTESDNWRLMTPEEIERATDVGNDNQAVPERDGPPLGRTDRE